MHKLISKLKQRLQTTRSKIIFTFIVVLGIVCFILYENFFPEIDLQAILDGVANFLGQWTYLVVGIVSFIETGIFIGMVFPGETVIILGGAIAGQGVINVYILIGIAWVAAFLGDSVSFYLGHKLGRQYILKHGSKVGINESSLKKVEGYFADHGGKTILLGRFIGFVRAIAPFIAGSSSMKYRVFVPYSILGSGLQTTFNILVGYFFAKSINAAAKYASQATLIIISLIIAVFIVRFLIRFFRQEENRNKAIAFLNNHAVGRWILRAIEFVKPPLLWITNRLTPGGNFGLEVTTLAAVLAVSSFVVFAYINILAGHSELITHGDTTAIKVVDFISNEWLDGAAEVLRKLGSLAVIAPVSVLAGLFFIFERKWYLLIVMAFSLITISSGQAVMDYLITRPLGSGFPNKEAAFSIFYAWLAIAVVVRVVPGITQKAGILLLGLLLPVLIGLSKVYLGMNLITDTNAGWAFGTAIFSLFSLIMIVIHQLNEGKPSKTKETV